MRKKNKQFVFLLLQILYNKIESTEEYMRDFNREKIKKQHQSTGNVLAFLHNFNAGKGNKYNNESKRLNVCNFGLMKKVNKQKIKK